jgi:protein TonB
MKSLFTALASAILICASATSIAAEVSPVLDSKSCEAPKYPKAALMNEEQGTVALMFLVPPDGHVSDSKVEKSSGSKSLDKAALTAFTQCKFKPGMKDGKPDALWAKVEFNWKLD